MSQQSQHVPTDRPQDRTLREKIFASAKLSSLQFASAIGLRLISTVVLTRLLAPEIYGVFAVVLVYLYLLEMMSDLGLRSLILTREGEVTPGFLSTCWSVSILRGVLILLLSCIIAGVIGGLQGAEVFAQTSPYAADVLPWAIVGLGVATLLFGFESPGRFLREREMKFGRVTVVDLTRNVVTLLVVIGLAIYLRSVWALVIGQMVRSCLHVGLSFVAFPTPGLRLTMNRSDLAILIDRGKWILGQSTLTALSQSSDRVLLGLVMNSSTFGFYYIARQLTDMVPMFLQAMNGQMGMQVFSRLKEQGLEVFRHNYYRYRLVFDGLAGLATGGIIVLAPLVVEIVFDDRYAGVAPIMQVVVLATLLTGPLIWRDVFNAERRFKVGTLSGLAATATLWVGLCLAVFVFDSVPMALIVVALYRVPEVLLLLVLGRLEGWVSLRREGLVLVFCALGAALGWGVLHVWNLIT